MTTPAPLPRARGLVVALVGLGLPVLAHVAAGGSVGIPPATVLPLALIAALCVTASAKTWTVTRLTVALTGVGVVTHAALLAGHASHGVGGGLPAVTHHVPGLRGPGAALPIEAAGGDATHSLGSSPQMVTAHVAAVALSVVLLRHGEAFLLWLASLAERIFLPEVGLIPSPRLSRFSLLSTAHAISSYVGGSGGARAPPLLASI